MAHLSRATLKAFLPTPVVGAAVWIVDRSRGAVRRFHVVRASVLAFVDAYASAVLALGRNAPVEEIVAGNASFAGAKKVAVFCHYDVAGDVSPATVQYVAALAAAQHIVVFVSTAPELEERALEVLKTHCALILRRKNVGYDFGSWKVGLEHVPSKADLDSLIIANDSVLGPFAPLEPYIDRCDASSDVWGFTDSGERGWHLQSYFVLFRQTALRHPAFARFWRGVLMARSKHWAIRAGELRLSRELMRAGLRMRALFPTVEVIGREASSSALPVEAVPVGELDQAGRIVLMRRGVRLNPSHALWRVLIEVWGFPFIKRELIAKNPMKLLDVDDWQDVVSRRFGGDVLPGAVADATTHSPVRGGP